MNENTDNGSEKEILETIHRFQKIFSVPLHLHQEKGTGTDVQ